MKPETAQIVETELRRFAADLNLSDDQKTQLRDGLEKAQARLDEIRNENPDVTRADVVAKIVAERDSLRERVVNFFTPEQLAKWDAEVAKAKTFLGASVGT
jgi:DNA-binding MurR/RpiR family transcriptional regulator